MMEGGNADKKVRGSMSKRTGPATSLFMAPGLPGGQCFSHANSLPLFFMPITHTLLLLTSYHEERKERDRQREGKEGTPCK